MSLPVRLVTPDAISGDLARRWDELRGYDPASLAASCDIRFYQTLHPLRPVQIALVGDPDRPAAMIPFHNWNGAGRPAGRPLIEFDCFLAEPEWRADSKDLLNACGMQDFEFSYLSARTATLEPHFGEVRHSPFIDPRSFKPPSNHRRKMRRLADDAGPIEIQVHDTDETSLETLFSWKRQQYLKTNVSDILQHAWVRETLLRLYRRFDGKFGCSLASLRAGGKLIAAHLGLRSGSNVHWWFPAYDPDFSNSSPGLLLLCESAAILAKEDVERIDLGAGPEGFKQQLKTGDFPVAAGYAGLSPYLAWRRKATRWGKRFLHNSVLSRPARAIHRWIVKLRNGAPSSLPMAKSENG